ncbi:hypothetical protein LCGC14_1541790 [marine sediment metagenome]|uniref:Replication protein n=1 Tax=marine sediment metagenome TaxID=412755 RepID=A0A0F9JDT1_9ZZZZ
MLTPTMSNRHPNDHPTGIGVEDSAYQQRVFADVAAERDRIIGAMIDAETGRHLALANKLADCCRSPMLLADIDATTMRLSERRCRSRVCPRCRRFRARQVQHRLLNAVTKMDGRRFLTLTLQSTNDTLADQLQHLRQSFARLRRQAFWKAAVTGGVYCVEMTWNPSRSQWHPHLHAIIDGSYVPKRSLSAGWLEATGSSFIVDIRRVYSAASVASYVAKYVAKSDDASSLPDHVLPAWADAVHGLRLVHTFGNLHGVDLQEKPEKQPGVIIEVIALTRLAAASQRGDLVAASLLGAIDAAAGGNEVEPHQTTIARCRAWQAWDLSASRSRALARPPPRSPPRQAAMSWV